MKKEITDFQRQCLHAMLDYQIREKERGKIIGAQIMYRGQVGVTVTLKGGHKVFYSLNAIMDPINRFVLSRNVTKKAKIV